MEVVSGAELEGVRVWWEKGQDVGQGAGHVEEFLDLTRLAVLTKLGGGTYQSDAVDFHARLRELRSHGDEVSGNIHWVLEGHAWIIAI